MKKGEFTIEKSMVECYKIRHETGMYWADITIDVVGDGTKGRISISSDYGKWANYWGACGHHFKEFLTDLNVEYAADKFDADRWFDHEGTINGYKWMVIESRRDESINAEEAREIWSEINSLDDCTDENVFISEMWNNRKLMRFFDGCPDISRSITPQFRNFWKNVWPVFIEKLNEEIKERKELKEVKELNVTALFGETLTGNLKKNTWTFEMKEPLKLKAGEFAIMKKADYDELVSNIRKEGK